MFLRGITLCIKILEAARHNESLGAQKQLWAPLLYIRPKLHLQMKLTSTPAIVSALFDLVFLDICNKV